MLPDALFLRWSARACPRDGETGWTGKNTAVILKPQWRGLLFVLIVFALLLRQGLAVMLLGLPALTILAAELWSRWALRRVTYERMLSSDRGLIGDEITLTLRIANRKDRKSVV